MSESNKQPVHRPSAVWWPELEKLARRFPNGMGLAGDSQDAMALLAAKPDSERLQPELLGHVLGLLVIHYPEQPGVLYYGADGMLRVHALEEEPAKVEERRPSAELSMLLESAAALVPMRGYRRSKYRETLWQVIGYAVMEHPDRVGIAFRDASCPSVLHVRVLLDEPEKDEYGWIDKDGQSRYYISEDPLH